MIRISSMALPNPLKEKLALGHTVMGMWSIVPSPVVVEILGIAGLDFVLLDMEHGIFDTGALDACIRACETTDASPLVRLPGANPSAAQWALDLGAHGIIVPQVDTAEDASHVVGMAKYAPIGHRGYNPFTRAADYSNPPDNTSGKLDNNFSLTAVIVESERAIANLSAICATPSLDVVYVGVYDLAVAMGHQGDTRHVEVLTAVEAAIATIRRSGKAAGMMVRTQAEIETALALGANFLVYSVDTALILDAARSAVQQLASQLNSSRISAPREGAAS